MKQLFTLTTLRKKINSELIKKTGKPFTVGDVQGYIKRGKLPKYLGGTRIIEHEQVAGVKTYKLK